MRDEIRRTGKRPRDAFTEMMTNIPKKFKSEDVQTKVVLQVPTFQSVRRQLSRHRVERCVPVPDPTNIPALLRTTLRGREADDDSTYKDEKFLLYTGQEGELSCYHRISQDIHLSYR